MYCFDWTYSTCLLAGCFLLSSLRLIGQGTMEGTSTNVIIQEQGDSLVIKGLFQNKTEQPLNITYQLKLERKDVNANTLQSSQNGQHVVGPDSLITLAKTTINGAETDEFLAQLEVFLDGQRIGFDDYRGLNERKIQKNTPQNNDPQGIELGGFVFDQTKTVWGQQFYELFTNKWQQIVSGGSYFITLEEALFRGRTTLIQIKLDGELIFEQVLQPKYDYLNDLADAGVQVAIQQAQQQEQFDESLQQEGDLFGTGIY